ncbi:MAG: cytochrome P450 [Flavobacteriales bacterium]|nr:cytochrome P450 [Flavobacteriales bacterium]
MWNRLITKIPEFDFKDKRFVADPYPTYKKLRKTSPIFQLGSGAWVLLKHEDVLNALSDNRLSNVPSPYALLKKENRDRYVSADVAHNILPFMDSPEHDIPRRNVVQAYRNTMKESRLDLESIAADLIESSISVGNIKVLEDFARPYAFAVMSDLFDIPFEDWKRLEKFCEAFFYLFMPIPSQEMLQEVEEGLKAFRNYWKEKLDERRGGENNDLLSQLANAGTGGQALTDSQVIDNAMLLFADGIENVDRGIANAILCLVDHPKQWRLLKEDGSLIPQAVEECLRFESPAQFITRIAKEDIELEGQHIKKSMPIFLVLGSANRDPSVFQNPDRFSIKRETNKHLSFGRGKHTCVGSGLVNLEIAAVLKVLTNRIKAVKRNQRELHWMPRQGHRWLRELTIEFS